MKQKENDHTHKNIKQEKKQ